MCSQGDRLLRERDGSGREADAEREPTGPPHHFTACCASSAFFTPLAKSTALPLPQ